MRQSALAPLAALALFFGIILASPATPASAQDRDRQSSAEEEAETPLTARQVAAAVQSFYDQTTTIRSSFRQVHYDRTYRRTRRSRGILNLARPGKLRLDYLGQRDKVVIANDSTLTVYEGGEDGEAGQYFRSEMGASGLSSALGLLMGTSRLDRDYRFRLHDGARFRFDGPVLELRPREAQASYRRLFLYVDGGEQSLGVVRRILVQDHEGNLNRFDFGRMRFNRPQNASRFRFSPPAGSHRVSTGAL